MPERARRSKVPASFRQYIGIKTNITELNSPERRKDMRAAILETRALGAAHRHLPSLSPNLTPAKPTPQRGNISRVGDLWLLSLAAALCKEF
jgi:hypothetical protein